MLGIVVVEEAHMIPERILQVNSSFAVDKVMLVYLTGRTFSSEPSGSVPSEPESTLLTYPGDNSASDVTYSGGAIAPSIPVQILFWGDYWNDSPGAATRDLLITKVQELLSGPYTSALDQYGITPPVYGGSRVVTNWPPPTEPYSCADVSDLVWNLIDNDHLFPDPDDPGGRNAYVAFMPPGTAPAAPTPSGAHAEYADFDLPFDIEKLWVAYVDYDRNNGDINTLTTVFAHELVELVTDPELDGWHSASIGDNGGEIGDLCEDKNGRKTAWVGNVQVPAYWSVRDNVCVIPTYPFQVRLDGEVGIREKSLDAQGEQSYPMSAPGGGLCAMLPACCFKGPYLWQRFQRREFTTVRLGLSGYHSPQITWAIAGQTVSGSGSIAVVTQVTREGPEAVSTEPLSVTLDYTVGPTGLFLANNHMVGNFDVQVSVAVSDASASGGVSTNRTAAVLVPFIGYEFDWDEHFQNDQKACDQARQNFWKATHPANRTRIRIPAPDPQTMHAWVSARQVRLAGAAFQEAGRLRPIDPAAARDLLTILLRRIGLPKNRGGAIDRQH